MDEFFTEALKIKNLAWYLVGGGIALLIIFGVIWWNMVYQNPYNVYWGMLSNSLSTSSVTKHLTQKSGATSLDQLIAFNFGTQNYAYGRTVLKDPVSTVHTESIGTIKNDFIRYTNIETKQKNRKGKTINFSPVLGKWAKADAVNAPAQNGSAPFFIQSVIGLAGGNTVPIVNLPEQQRESLMKLLHDTDVYKTDVNKVKKKVVDGKMLYTYDVSVEPVAYVAFEKQLANDLGIKTLSQIDPENYASQDAIKMNFVVDAHSHRLSAIKFQSSSHTETYTAYGMPPRTDIPKTTISDTKLQELLTSVQ
ncbi:MAG TPA: hypothetical protein VLG47_03535 [Candidatus Saccharimonadales bacterium]|nr:hypothetical protein [Candidatus Saccharimonadales bacterium]